jgi:hypothetical protein
MRDKVNNHSDHDFHIYLSNQFIGSGDRSTDELKADIPEIAFGNGYSGSIDTQNTFSNVGKVYTMFGESILLTAAGGDIGPWRNILLFNFETAVKVDPLVCHWDHGDHITIPDGTTHEILFNGAAVGQDGAMLEIKSIV